MDMLNRLGGIATRGEVRALRNGHRAGLALTVVLALAGTAASASAEETRVVIAWDDAVQARSFVAAVETRPWETCR